MRLPVLLRRPPPSPRGVLASFRSSTSVKAMAATVRPMAPSPATLIASTTATPAAAGAAVSIATALSPSALARAKTLQECHRPTQEVVDVLNLRSTRDEDALARPSRFLALHQTPETEAFRPCSDASMEGVGSALPDSRLLVFDNARGVRESLPLLESGVDYSFSRIGAEVVSGTICPRTWRPWSVFSSLGALFGRLHPIVRVLDQCDAVLDVSGGDSFSDIYGSHRFWSVIRPKLIAKRRGIPLVLLPQTYGPFRGRQGRPLGQRSGLGATMAWARDRFSFDELKDLLGSDFDASRHREGVDMAFILGVVDPRRKLGPEIRNGCGRSRTSADRPKCEWPDRSRARGAHAGSACGRTTWTRSRIRSLGDAGARSANASDSPRDAH